MSSIIDTSTNMGQNRLEENVQNSVITQRLKVPYSTYNYNQNNTIKSLIGSSAKILETDVNEFILDDESLVIDVKYQSLMTNLSQTKIYYIDRSEIKKVQPNSDKSAVRVQGCNVLINSRINDNFKKLIPIKISTVDSMENYQYFPYYGIVVRTPMNFLCTPLTVDCKFIVEEVVPMFPDKYVPKMQYSKAEILRAYKYNMQKFPILQNCTDIIEANDFSQCTKKTAGYLIDWRNLIKDRDYINGIILIQPIRSPYEILYFVNTMFVIDSDEIESINEFLKQDEINFKNFDYVTNVINK